MTSTTWLLALALTLAAARPAAAQTALTLDGAIERVIAHSPVLEGARASSDQSAAQGAETRSAFFPRISFQESWQRGNEPVFVFGALLASRQFSAMNFAIDQLNRPDRLSLHRATLSVGQTLFDGGRTASAVAIAGRRRELADIAVDQTRADLTLAATRTFGRLLTAQSSQLAAASAETSAAEDLARAEHRRDVGTATDADVLAVAVHLAEVRQRAIRSATEAAIARAELNRLMGAPIDDEYRVQEPLAAVAVPGDLSTLLAEADKASPEIARATAAEQLAKAGTRQARAAWFPEVSAQAGVEMTGTRLGARATSWVAGGDVRWAISTGGADMARVRAATASTRQATASLADTRAAVHVEVVTAFRQIESARARFVVGGAAVADALERLRILRNRYEAGLASVNDVLQGAAAVEDADSARVSAVVEALVSQALLAHALGRAVQPGTTP